MSEPTEPTKPTAESTKPVPESSQLIDLVKSLQFAWFIGHVITLIGIFFYTLTYLRIGTGYYKFWYQLSLIGIIESFGILIYQISLKKGTKLTILLKDDNTHYLFLGLLLLFLRPYVLLTLSSFALYSTFHVLAYIKGYLLPIFHYDSHPVSEQIGSLINSNNAKSIQLASILEIYTLGWLLIRMFTFRKRSLSPVLIYLIFIKLRYEKLIFTRNYFKTIEIKLEEFVNNANIPIVKQVWIQIKQVTRQVGGFYLVNDFTKEKST